MFRGLLSMLSLVVALSAQAQIFADDFETGNTSRWNGSTTPQPGSSRAVIGDAGHRGQYGYRVVDGYSAGGAGGDVQINRTVNADGGTFDVHFRFWLRLAPTSVAADINPAAIQGNIAISTMTELVLRSTGFRLNTFDRSSNFSSVGVDGGWDAGVWMLMELASMGVGGADGGSRLYRDGALIADIEKVDWSGVALQNLVIGNYGGYAWLGTLDFDDARASLQPQASTLILRSADAGTTSSCSWVSVALQASIGLPAGAPYDLDVALTATDGGVDLFAADCASPLSGIHFDAGQLVATALVRPRTTGFIQLRAEHLDFLPGTTSLVATDGGAGSQELLTVGCDCSSAGTGIAWIGLAAALLLGRRRSS